jgi:F0F1-type ATP synthase assembly protein I
MHHPVYLAAAVGRTGKSETEMMLPNLPESEQRKVGAYLTLGAAYAATVLFFVALGVFLDHRLGATPIFTLIGVLVGGAAGFYSLVRRAMAVQAGSKGGKLDDGARDQSQRRRTGSAD